MGLTRGTTPTIIIEFEDEIDLSDVDYFYLTIKQYGCEITKKSDDPSISVDVENSEISWHLTQEETLTLTSGRAAELQLRGVFKNGEVFASDIPDDDICRILHEGVI